jgi:transcriptional regulator with XRE-family HTH domain
MHRPLSSAQIRAARSLIRWSAENLARRCSLSVATIRRAELTDGETSMTAANDLAVRAALEDGGVEFIDENGGGPGVRLKKAKREARKPRDRINYSASAFTHRHARINSLRRTVDV